MIFYEVGGSVRDSLMGRAPNDIDMVVVPERSDWDLHGMSQDTHPFEVLLDDLALRGFTVAQVNRAHMTVRAIVPNGFSFAGWPVKGAIDVVLARTDAPTDDGRHPSSVSPGSLTDDLWRRDFTVNAIARSSDGSIIDPHGGVHDARDRVLRCVGNPRSRMNDDRLRIMRALRISVTHSMRLSEELIGAIDEVMRSPHPFRGVSEDRMREELTRMFSADVHGAITALMAFGLTGRLFTGRLWLKPTTEAR